MLSTRGVRRVAILCGLAVVTAMQVAAGGAVAGAQPSDGGRIHPNQVFGALVNGANGLAAPVVIEMACFGALKPGETGHPMAGQTVTVFQPEAINGDFGNTGTSGHEIGAFFAAPPPGPASKSGGPVIFHHYVTRKLPTSEVLPCSGTGNIFFVPLPMSPGSQKDVVVPVAYAGQP